uniref:Uncharacterized protein n=1 Tax=Anopheles atroparvus TaxID=41427 RepID=A0A182J170_ANOAO
MGTVLSTQDLDGAVDRADQDGLAVGASGCTTAAAAAAAGSTVGAAGAASAPAGDGGRVDARHRDRGVRQLLQVRADVGKAQVKGEALLAARLQLRVERPEALPALDRPAEVGRGAQLVEHAADVAVVALLEVPLVVRLGRPGRDGVQLLEHEDERPEQQPVLLDQQRPARLGQLAGRLLAHARALERGHPLAVVGVDLLHRHQPQLLPQQRDAAQLVHQRLHLLDGVGHLARQDVEQRVKAEGEPGGGGRARLLARRLARRLAALAQHGDDVGQLGQLLVHRADHGREDDQVRCVLGHAAQQLRDAPAHVRLVVGEPREQLRRDDAPRLRRRGGEPLLEHLLQPERVLHDEAQQAQRDGDRARPLAIGAVVGGSGGARRQRRQLQEAKVGGGGRLVVAVHGPVVAAPHVDDGVQPVGRDVPGERWQRALQRLEQPDRADRGRAVQVELAVLGEVLAALVAGAPRLVLVQDGHDALAVGRRHERIGEDGGHLLDADAHAGRAARQLDHALAPPVQPRAELEPGLGERRAAVGGALQQRPDQHIARAQLGGVVGRERFGVDRWKPSAQPPHARQLQRRQRELARLGPARTRQPVAEREHEAGGALRQPAPSHQPPFSVVVVVVVLVVVRQQRAIDGGRGTGRKVDRLQPLARLTVEPLAVLVDRTRQILVAPQDVASFGQLAASVGSVRRSHEGRGDLLERGLRGGREAAQPLRQARLVVVLLELAPAQGVVFLLAPDRHHVQPEVDVLLLAVVPARAAAAVGQQKLGPREQPHQRERAVELLHAQRADAVVVLDGSGRDATGGGVRRRRRRRRRCRRRRCLARPLRDLVQDVVGDGELEQVLVALGQQALLQVALDQVGARLDHALALLDLVLQDDAGDAVLDRADHLVAGEVVRDVDADVDQLPLADVDRAHVVRLLVPDDRADLLGGDRDQRDGGPRRPARLLRQQELVQLPVVAGEQQRDDGLVDDEVAYVPVHAGTGRVGQDRAEPVGRRLPVAGGLLRRHPDPGVLAPGQLPAPHVHAVQCVRLPVAHQRPHQRHQHVLEDQVGRLAGGNELAQHRLRVAYHHLRLHAVQRDQIDRGPDAREPLGAGGRVHAEERARRLLGRGQRVRRALGRVVDRLLERLQEAEQDARVPLVGDRGADVAHRKPVAQRQDARALLHDRLDAQEGALRLAERGAQLVVDAQLRRLPLRPRYEAAQVAQRHLAVRRRLVVRARQQLVQVLADVGRAVARERDPVEQGAQVGHAQHRRLLIAQLGRAALVEHVLQLADLLPPAPVGTAERVHLAQRVAQRQAREDDGVAGAQRAVHRAEVHAARLRDRLVDGGVQGRVLADGIEAAGAAQPDALARAPPVHAHRADDRQQPAKVGALLQHVVVALRLRHDRQAPVEQQLEQLIAGRPPLPRPVAHGANRSALRCHRRVRPLGQQRGEKAQHQPEVVRRRAGVRHRAYRRVIAAAAAAAGTTIACQLVMMAVLQAQKAIEGATVRLRLQQAAGRDEVIVRGAVMVGDEQDGMVQMAVAGPQPAVEQGEPLEQHVQDGLLLERPGDEDGIACHRERRQHEQVEADAALRSQVEVRGAGHAACGLPPQVCQCVIQVVQHEPVGRLQQSDVLQREHAMVQQQERPLDLLVAPEAHRIEATVASGAQDQWQERHRERLLLGIVRFHIAQQQMQQAAELRITPAARPSNRSMIPSISAWTVLRPGSDNRNMRNSLMAASGRSDDRSASTRVDRIVIILAQALSKHWRSSGPSSNPPPSGARGPPAGSPDSTWRHLNTLLKAIVPAALDVLDELVEQIARDVALFEPVRPKRLQHPGAVQLQRGALRRVQLPANDDVHHVVEEWLEALRVGAGNPDHDVRHQHEHARAVGLLQQVLQLAAQLTNDRL